MQALLASCQSNFLQWIRRLFIAVVNFRWWLVETHTIIDVARWRTET